MTEPQRDDFTYSRSKRTVSNNFARVRTTISSAVIAVNPSNYIFPQSRKMSKRTRTSKIVKPTKETPTIGKAWTYDDKSNLLKALRTHGHTNIEEISRLLPEKTPSAIRLMIHKIMKKARSVTYNENPALKAWLASETFGDKTDPVPQTLKFISLFEQHPSTEECCGFDFKAAYDYLHRKTLSLPATELSGETLERLNALMEEVKSEVWPAAEDDIVGYLGTLNMKERARKCYPPKKELRPMKSDYWSYMSGQTS